uniref:Folylpolyglutamate synthase n=1 Tax=Parastrongyloides trichosuri TaxID=131310 RepID=A0A0N4Z4S3_PARTI
MTVPLRRRSSFLYCGAIMEMLHKCSLYDDAIIKLNSLISNAKAIEEARKNKYETQSKSLPMMRKYFEACNIDIKELDKLNVIHIAGSKGKGTTCAMIESILRDRGYKTGFFSSPHLVDVTERIRINGEQIDKDMFSKYFFNIYTKLVNNNISPLPGYFKFLTILAYHTFLKENVDVAIMEVGIGGEYDSTNIIEKPTVCGITTLDYDHTHLLGETIQEIAWQKGGIMKNLTPCITIPQEEEAMSVLYSRSEEKGSMLSIAPTLDESLIYSLQFPGKHQLSNLSLAIEIAKRWEEITNIRNKNNYQNIYSPEYLKRLFKNFIWRGRTQKIERNGIQYMVDGAHTQKSIEACTNWFMSDGSDNENGKCVKILVFSTTGERKGEKFLRILEKCKFNLVLFSSTIVKQNMKFDDSNLNLTIDANDATKKCYENQNIWSNISSGVPSEVFPTIEMCVMYINNLRKTTPDETEIRVLVTGSLHLVGGVISFIEN